jgi:Mor family transcriptional regulator
MVGNKKSQEVIAAFIEKFPGIQTPTRQAIHNLNTRFEDLVVLQIYQEAEGQGLLDLRKTYKLLYRLLFIVLTSP